jgi:hypothetical protein
MTKTHMRKIPIKGISRYFTIVSNIKLLPDSIVDEMEFLPQ